MENIFGKLKIRFSKFWIFFDFRNFRSQKFSGFSKKIDLKNLTSKILISKKFHKIIFITLDWPPSFLTYLIEEIFFNFRVFFSDLEISESFKNSIPNAPIRSRNLRLKK